MKNFVYLFVFVLLLLNFSSCSSSKTNTSEKDFLGIWYPEKPNSNTRILISEKLFISEGLVDIEKFKDENTIRFEVKDSIKVIEKEFIKNKENKNAISLILARQKDKKTQYNSFLFSETEIKGIMTVFAVTNGGYETIEEAKKGMEEAKFKDVKQELFFSEKYSKTVFPILKSMEDITKEDYIKVVKYVRSFENEIIAFAAQQEKSSVEYAIRGVSKKLAQKKLYFLGYYSPYGFQNSNYFKKFEGDKDIEKLNNVETKIKF